MVQSSKGKPTDPKLMEKVTEEVKNRTNKDGGGKGQWSAWKSAERAKEYEKKGGSYENEAGSKNQPKEGTPEEKTGDQKKEEESKTSSSAPKKKGTTKSTGKKAESSAKTNGSSSKATTKTAGSGRAKKQKPAPREGTRKSSRVAQQKRPAEESSESPKKKSRSA